MTERHARELGPRDRHGNPIEEQAPVKAAAEPVVVEKPVELPKAKLPSKKSKKGKK